MLTKSLHTVTAATNVARLLLIEKLRYYSGHRDGACKLAADALHVLGYDALVTVPYEFPGAELRRSALRLRMHADALVTNVQGRQRGNGSVPRSSAHRASCNTQTGVTQHEIPKRNGH